ncbi:MAG: hypothetical protein HN390_04540 [Anaerolineae bacterium]|jgi:hypothetical protein|nr:hypothetical protein [Anaerolineae bacterium]MBT7191159.1 hypothetical protein [Anaerolineae bacterium]MBT7990744.1 hypothetical protein [Anaerolineae bacterium]
MKIKFLTMAFLVAVLISACGAVAPASPPTLDVNTIYTAAAETVVAELTQTAAANSPTPKATATEIQALQTETPVPTSDLATETPEVTETPEATATILVEASPTDEFCDDAIWVADVSVQDGTEMVPGQDFEKTWLIENTGSCTWGEGYHLDFSYGEEMNGQARPLPAIISPDENVEVTVVFTAPLKTGEYSSTWRMANTKGVYFGEEIYVLIVVR